jgi:hypothetical protein
MSRVMGAHKRSTTVYFHIGAAKTGTSAIQVALARNRDALAKHGVVYPKSRSDVLAAQGLITSGNGELLYSLLWPQADRPGDAKQARHALQNLIRDNPAGSILYSSELFVSAPPEAFAALCQFIRDCGADVKVIYYVRHLMDNALSLYNQHVKWGGLTIDFIDYVRTRKCKFEVAIQTFSGIVGEGNLVLRLYDDQKSQLVQGFYRIVLPDAASVASSDFDFSRATEVVNRSLSPLETEIMLRINRVLKRQKCPNVKAVTKAISDKFIYQEKKSPARNQVTLEEMKLLKQNNRDVLRFVNRFAGDAFVLKLKSSAIRIVEEHRANDEEKVLKGTVSVLLDYITETAVQRDAVRKPGQRGVGADDFVIGIEQSLADD